MLLKAAESRIKLITQEIVDGCGARTVAASGCAAPPPGSVKKSFCKDRIAILGVPEVAYLQPGY
jgi:hypothetical protein